MRGQRFADVDTRPMGQSGRLRVLAFLAVVSLTACTSTSTGDGVPPPLDTSANPPVTTGPSGVDTKPASLRCQDLGASLEAGAAMAVASHPGPVRAATRVRAAKTSTGTWFVVGIDRAYVKDDGTLAGGVSRSLALSNAPGGANYIPLGEGTTAKPVATSWKRVSWTGDRLDAGKRALRKAVDCLDAATDRS